MNISPLKEHLPNAYKMTSEHDYLELRLAGNLLADIEQKGKKFHLRIFFKVQNTSGGLSDKILCSLKFNDFEEACVHIKIFLTELKTVIAQTLGE
jgi:hypothetical protein